MRHDWSNNPTPEGYVWDIYSSQAVERQRATLGFDVAEFDAATPTKIYYASALTSAAIQSAINTAAAAGGGIVQLPAGVGTLTAKIEIVDKTRLLIRGAGTQAFLQATPPTEETTLIYNGAARDEAFLIKDSQNILIRDLTLRPASGATKTDNGIHAQWCDNVRVERCTVDNFEKANVKFYFSQRVTVCYCLFPRAQKHCIGFKEIWGDIASEATVNNTFNAGGPHPYGINWSGNFAIYSNYANRPTMYLVNAHAHDGEIAGNKCIAGAQGIISKQMDGREILFHHNWFIGGKVGFMGRTIGYWRLSGRIIFCQNYFEGACSIECYGSGANGTIAYDYKGEPQFIVRENIWIGSGGKISNSAPASAMQICSGTNAGVTISGASSTADVDDCGGCGSPITVDPDPGSPGDSGCGAGNLVTNGDFTGFEDGWSFVTDGTATLDADSQFALVAITDGGMETLLSSDPFPVSSGSKYIVIVNASADSACSLPVVIEGASNYGYSDTLAIKTHANRFAAEFTANATANDAEIVFDFSALDNVTIAIDGVCVQAIASGSATANFTASVTSGTAPLSVTFADNSAADATITGWTWRANGSVFSTSQNPTHSFAAGVHDVSLTITASDGATDTLVKVGFIVVHQGAVGGTFSQTLTIADSNSGAERRVDGWSTNLAGLRTYHQVGLSWPLQTAIPSDATILSAYITLRAEGGASTPHAVIIRVEEAANPAAYTDETNWDARSWSTSSVSWTPSAWVNDTWYQSPDLASLIQHLIDTYGAREAGERVSLKLADEVDTADFLKFDDYEAGAAYAPQLYIQWSVPDPPTGGGRNIGRGTLIGIGAGMGV